MDKCLFIFCTISFLLFWYKLFGLVVYDLKEKLLLGAFRGENTFEFVCVFLLCLLCVYILCHYVCMYVFLLT